MFPMINNDSNSWGLCNISKAKLTYVGLFVEMIYLLFAAKKPLLGSFLCAFSSSGFISISHIGLCVFFSNPTKIEKRVSELKTKLLVWLI